MTSVRALILDLLGDSDRSIDDAANRYLAPDFRQKVNGHWLTRREFLDGVAALRQAGRSVDVTVLDELQAGDRYAERHLLTTTDTSGARTYREVFVFATLEPDGRFVTIEEVSIDAALTPE